jgi:hypothetical protein
MTEPTIKELQEKVSRMEALIDVLAAKLEAEIKNNAFIVSHSSRVRKLIRNDLNDSLERIKNIELKFFPHLADDVRRLYEIVPDGDKAWNPLDYRDP